jgi:mono/diheme cytochrome c family protein
MKMLVALAMVASLWLGALWTVIQAQPQNAATIDYQQHVHTILAAKCLTCHSAERRSGGLSLATYDDILNGGRSSPAVKPGNSADSLIVQRITGASAPRMPFLADPLSDAEIATIRTWIEQGARATPTSAAAPVTWEAPLILSAPAVPPVTWTRWNEPLDRFTSRYLANQQVAEPALVGDAEFARRAYLDAWGLLPDPDQLRTFVSDRDPGKRQKLVATLLDDKVKYSEHWISFWNDLLRNDEGITYYSETATRKSITPWLLNALETNKPYNQWIRQLLNPTHANDPDGFLIGVNWRGSVSASQTPAMQASQNTAQVFLGINFKCNSCHDSFINRWKLKDAYALASYFSAEEKLQLFRCDVAQPDQFATTSYMYPELNRPSPSASIADRRATVAAIFTDPRNGRVPRTLVNRVWAKLMGRGIVADVDDMDGEPWSPELLDWVASDFVANGYDLKRLIATIAGSRTYQLPAVARTDGSPKEYTFRGPELRRLTAEQFADAVASVTGDWHVAPTRATGTAGGAGSAGGAARRGGAAGGAGGSIAVFSGAPVEAAGINQGDGRRTGDVRRTQPARSRGGQPAHAPALIEGGTYAREWRIAANSLTRALGRPIRDQVFSNRDTQATTIQALELVNGETLTHWLSRGARKMLGELPPEPRSLFSRQVTGNSGPGSAPVRFDVDVSNAQKLYLIVEDRLSTAPDKATPLWLNASFTGPNGKTPLGSLTPVDTLALRDDPSPIVPLGSAAPVTDALRVKFPSVLVYDIAGKGFTRFEGVPTLENVPLTTGENVTARFFIFDQQPSMDRLVPPSPETPLPPGPVVKTIPEAVDRVYAYLLGRAPSTAEREIASAALVDPSRPGHPSAEGLADLLWSILMTPEFQLIR